MYLSVYAPVSFILSLKTVANGAMPIVYLLPSAKVNVIRSFAQSDIGKLLTINHAMSFETVENSFSSRQCFNVKWMNFPWESRMLFLHPPKMAEAKRFSTLTMSCKNPSSICPTTVITRQFRMRWYPLINKGVSSRWLCRLSVARCVRSNQFDMTFSSRSFPYKSQSYFTI